MPYHNVDDIRAAALDAGFTPEEVESFVEDYADEGLEQLADLLADRRENA